MEDFLFDSRGKVVYRRSSRNVAFHHQADAIKAVTLFTCHHVCSHPHFGFFFPFFASRQYKLIFMFGFLHV